jgi:hypothetical protein
VAPGLSCPSQFWLVPHLDPPIGVRGAASPSQRRCYLLGQVAEAGCVMEKVHLLQHISRLRSTYWFKLGRVARSDCWRGPAEGAWRLTQCRQSAIAD